MQQKNLLLFFFLSFLILFGWTMLSRQFMPPKPPRPAPKATAKPAPLANSEEGKHLRAVLSGYFPRVFGLAPGVPGLGDAFVLSSRLAMALTSLKPQPPAPQQKPELLLHLPIKPVPVATAPHRDDIRLGDDSFNIKALLTTRGGGIHELVLNNFKEADRLGKPTGKPLVLIPPSSDIESNLLYHYAKPDASNPESTLGTMDWTVQAEKNGPHDKAHEVVFTAVVPGMDVIITKTYTLKPQDYHIGLTLKFERKGNNPKPLSLRYQLTGAHGLPIEGVWYTSTYRNAMIGRINAKGEVLRNVQEAQEIAFKMGGDEVKREDNFIQYAGIVTQYFAAVIAVDNEQVQGIDRKDFLAWARPTFPGPKRWVQALAFTPDSRLLASGGSDRLVRIWNLTGAKPIEQRTLGGHKGRVTSVAFQPKNNQVLASGSYDQTVRLWHLGVGSSNTKNAPLGRSGPVLAVALHAAPVLGVAFSPDGTMLASACADGTVHLWDTDGDSLAPLAVLEGHLGPVTALAFSPDGKLLASASADHTVRLWDIEAKKATARPWFAGHQGEVTTVAFSPDGKTLASGGADRMVRLWDLTGKELTARAALAGHKDWVSAVAFCPDGKTLASASYDQTIRLWDLATLKQRDILEAADDSLWALAFSPDRQTLACGTYHKGVQLWDIAGAKPSPVTTLEGQSYPVVGDQPYPGKDFLNDITMRVVSEKFDLKPGVPVVHKYLLYNGPVKVGLLSHLEQGRPAKATLARYIKELHLNTLTDYRSPHTWAWVQTIGWTDLLIWCTNLMHNILWYFYHVIPNYGICIILLTICVRGVMFPLSRRQAISAAKMQAKMQELQPEIKKLEEKYKNDPAALRQAKTDLMLKRGANPLSAMGSCWMMFLQMPIFLGLYYALQESINFRLARFLWMPNLAAPDMLFFWTEYLPFISRPEDMRSSLVYLGPYFNLLPVIAVAFSIVQQKMLTPPPADEQAAMQQKVMKFMMVFLGFVFYKFAAGICLYYIASSAWGLMERKVFLKNKIAVATATPGKPSQPAVAAPAPAKRSKVRPTKKEGNGKLQKMRDFWEKVLKEARKK